MKNFKGRLVSLLLSAVLASSALATFAACAPREDDKEATVADATAVDYRTDGVYETTLTLPDSIAASFDGLTAKDVEAQYRYFDRDKYESDRNGAISAAAAKGDNNMTAGGVDPQKYYVDGKATVKSVEADGRTMTVSFEDTCKDHRYTESYTIFIDSKGIAASVNVNRQNISISVADTDAEKKVYSSDKEVTFSVAIDGSKFSSGLSVNDIHLGGSFESMQAKILSKAEKNFTLQLKGNVQKYADANVYLDGTVEIDPAGMENASGSVSLSIPITVAAARFVAEEFKMQGADCTVPIELGDAAALGLNFSALTKDNFTFEKSVSLEEAEEEENSGIIVRDFQKTGETRGILTLGVGEAADLNAAAKILSGCTVKIDGGEKPVMFATGISAAGFYPVFDYAEQKGGEIELTLILHADNGKFGQLSEGMLSFGSDFEKARVVSLNKTDDLNATLVIAVLADDQTAETFDKDGTIELASGALVNVWGDVSTEPASYFRNYSQDSMGRDLSQNDVNTIKNIVGGFGNTAFGTISGVVSGAASGVNGIITVLELTGIRKSERVMLEEITQKLTQIQETLSMQTEMLEKLQQNDLQKDVETFDTLLMSLNEACDKTQKYLQTAALDSTNVKLPVPAEPVKGIDESGKKFDESDEAFQKRKQQYETELEGYEGELVNKILEQEQKQVFLYKGFSGAYNDLATYFSQVANTVLKTSIIDQYDELCTYLFNFETQTYPSRYAFRFEIYCALARAISLLMVYYDNEINNGTLSVLAPLFVNATQALKDSGFSEKNGNRIKIQCYSLNKTMYNELDIEYWGRDPYVCYKTGFADKTDAFDDGTDLDDAGRAKFLQRMQGRTILEELRLARFSNLEDCMEKAQYSYIDGTPYQKDICGVAFFCWDESKYFAFKGTYHYYYAWIMEWNSKEYTSRMCSYNKTGEVWCRYATWIVA